MAAEGADAGAGAGEVAFARAARASEGLRLAGLREELPCLDLEALDFAAALRTVLAACSEGALLAPDVDGLESPTAWGGGGGSLAMLSACNSVAPVASTVGSRERPAESCIKGVAARGPATEALAGIVCGNDVECTSDDPSNVGVIASMA